MTCGRVLSVRSARKGAPAELAAVLGARLAAQAVKALRPAELAALAEDLAAQLAEARETHGTSRM